MRRNKDKIWLQFLLYPSSRQDMRALEVFSGLYKHAAILHFPVSAFTAKSVSVACGGSGRGLPADARLQFFPRLFPFQSIFFTLQDPSGRTCCVDKGRLQHSNYRHHSVSVFSECQQEWGLLLCVDRPGDAAAAAAAASERARRSRGIYWGYASHRLMGT